MNKKWKEKELEEYIFDNPTALTGAMYPVHHTDKFHIVGRQVRCQYGIIDLILGNGSGIIVVELKARKADEKTIGQIIRYKSCIDMLINYSDTLSPPWELMKLDRYRYEPERCVTYCVVAPSFDKFAIPPLRHMGWPIVASKTSDGFKFDIAPTPPAYRYSCNVDDQNRELVDNLAGWISALRSREMQQYKDQIMYRAEQHLEQTRTQAN